MASTTANTAMLRGSATCACLEPDPDGSVPSKDEAFRIFFQDFAGQIRQTRYSSRTGYTGGDTSSNIDATSIIDAIGNDAKEHTPLAAAAYPVPNQGVRPPNPKKLLKTLRRTFTHSIDCVSSSATNDFVTHPICRPHQRTFVCETESVAPMQPCNDLGRAARQYRTDHLLLSIPHRSLRSENRSSGREHGPGILVPETAPRAFGIGRSRSDGDHVLSKG